MLSGTAEIIHNEQVVASNYRSNFISSIYGSMCITENRNLISFGKNVIYYLGGNEESKILIPTEIPNVTQVNMIDCGYQHTIFTNFDGILYSFGDNNKGQLGTGKTNLELGSTHIPQQVTTIPTVNTFSCGSYFTICITDNGLLYSFGFNSQGQLGIGNNNSSATPQLINDLNDIEFIQCGRNHSICKTYSGDYYSWGTNIYGELGQENKGSCSTPIQCLNWPKDVIDIKCGSHHTLLLTLFGYVYSMGWNNYGQLGLNDENIKSVNMPTLIKDIPLIKRIECGYYRSLCLDIDDKLWLFGDNKLGQLGFKEKQNIFKPTLNESLHDIIDISARGNHSFVKTINNEIYAFGDNNCSQLGIKTSLNHQLTPIQVFKDNEDIWVTDTRRSKQKSARK